MYDPNILFLIKSAKITPFIRPLYYEVIYTQIDS